MLRINVVIDKVYGQDAGAGIEIIHELVDGSFVFYFDNDHQRCSGFLRIQCAGRDAVQKFYGVVATIGPGKDHQACDMNVR